MAISLDKIIKTTKLSSDQTFFKNIGVPNTTNYTSGFTNTVNENPSPLNYQINGVDIAENSIAYYIDSTQVSGIISAPNWAKKIRAVIIGGGGAGQEYTAKNDVAETDNHIEKNDYKVHNNVVNHQNVNQDVPANGVQQNNDQNYNGRQATSQYKEKHIQQHYNFYNVQPAPVIPESANYDGSQRTGGYADRHQNYNLIYIAHQNIHQNNNQQIEHVDYRVESLQQSFKQQHIPETLGFGGGGGGFIYLSDYTFSSSSLNVSINNTSTTLTIDNKIFIAYKGGDGNSSIGTGGSTQVATGVQTQTINGQNASNTAGGNSGAPFASLNYGKGGDGGTSSSDPAGKPGKDGYYRIYYLT